MAKDATEPRLSWGRVWNWISNGFTFRDLVATLVTYPPIVSVLTAAGAWLEGHSTGEIVFYALMAGVAAGLLAWVVSMLIGSYRYSRPKLTATFAPTRFLTDAGGEHAVVLHFDIRNPGAATRVTDWGVSLLPLGGSTPVEAVPVGVGSPAHSKEDGSRILSPKDCYGEYADVPHVGTPGRKRLVAWIRYPRLDDLMRPGTKITLTCVDHLGRAHAFSTTLDRYESQDSHLALSSHNLSTSSDRSSSQGAASAFVRPSVRPHRQRGTLWIDFTNEGEGVARNVALEAFKPLNEGKEDVLISGEAERKFPVPKLRPRESVSLMAAPTMGSPSEFEVVIGWDDPSGQRRQEDFRIDLFAV